MGHDGSSPCRLWRADHCDGIWWEYGVWEAKGAVVEVAQEHHTSYVSFLENESRSHCSKNQLEMHSPPSSSASPPVCLLVMAQSSSSRHRYLSFLG